MADIKLVEYLKHLGWSLNYLKSFQCDWKVMRDLPACDEKVKGILGNQVPASDIRGALCNSCWARTFAGQELAEVEKMLRQLGAEVPDWNEIPKKKE